jgi:hypothetical protein
MNTNNVVSADAATNLTGKEYRVVKLTSTGVDLCTSAATAIGTLIRAMPYQEDGVYLGKSVAVQLLKSSLHFATIGNSSAAVAKGATLALDPATGNEGKLVPSGSNVIALAWEAFAAADGAVVRVIFV